MTHTKIRKSIRVDTKDKVPLEKPKTKLFETLKNDIQFLEVDDLDN